MAALRRDCGSDELRVAFLGGFSFRSQEVAHVVPHDSERVLESVRPATTSDMEKAVLSLDFAELVSCELRNLILIRMSGRKIGLAL